MKIWFDTKFIEDGKTIDLISIGMVREDGETYYAESSECDLFRASDWVVNNVFPHLTGPKLTREQIRYDILVFAGAKPEFWAYYCAYDWVVLCQLFGKMIDLPKGWPMFCMDVKQLCVENGNIKLPPKLAAEHNALSDAIWTREAWNHVCPEVATALKGSKHKPSAVVSATQSPMNALRWSLSLSCGHDVWVTSKSKPTRKLWLCARCEQR